MYVMYVCSVRMLFMYVHIIFAFMLSGVSKRPARSLFLSKKAYHVSRQDTETWITEGPWPHQPVVPLRQMLIFM